MTRLKKLRQLFRGGTDQSMATQPAAPAAQPTSQDSPTQPAGPTPPAPPTPTKSSFRKQVRNFNYAMAAVSIIVSCAWTYQQNPSSDFLAVAVGLVLSVAFLIMGFTYEIHSRLDEFSVTLDDSVRGTKAEVDKALGQIDGDLRLAAERIDNNLSVAFKNIERNFDAVTGNFKTSFGEMLEHLDDVVECRYLGPGLQTLKQVLDRLTTAQSVRNTFVLFGVAEKDAYASDQFKEVNKKIQDFLRKGGSWADIVSQDVVNSPTMSWLRFLSELDEEARQDGGTDAREAIERYRMSHLKGIYPLINFMIVRYDDDKDEVIFGWGHHTEEPTGRVFLSRNPRLIATFDEYWKILEKDSVLVQPQSRPITPAEITGLWFRVSYLVDVVPDWKARAGVPPAAEKYFHDMALVRISVEDNRNLFVEGRRFEFVGDGPPAGQARRIKRTEGFESNAADLKGTRLWFSTTSGSDEKLHIAGWYRFVQDEATPGNGRNPNFSGDIRIQSFYGEFVEYQENKGVNPDAGGSPSAREEQQNSAMPFKYQVGRLLLYGRKVPMSWLEGGRDSEASGEVPKGGGSKKAADFCYDIPNSTKSQLSVIQRGWQWWNSEGKESWRYGHLDADETDAAGGADSR